MEQVIITILLLLSCFCNISFFRLYFLFLFCFCGCLMNTICQIYKSLYIHKDFIGRIKIVIHQTEYLMSIFHTPKHLTLMQYKEHVLMKLILFFFPLGSSIPKFPPVFDIMYWYVIGI